MRLGALGESQAGQAAASLPRGAVLQQPKKKKKSRVGPVAVTRVSQV